MTANEFEMRYGPWLDKICEIDHYGYWQNTESPLKRLIDNEDTCNITIDSSFVRGNFNCNGAFVTNTLSIVYYESNHITYHPIFQFSDALSSQFAGCYMAKFMFDGEWYVCHIHNGSNLNMLSVFSAFLARQKQRNKLRLRDVIIFLPHKQGLSELRIDLIRQQAQAFPQRLGQLDRNYQIVGLIRGNDHRCYSALYDVAADQILEVQEHRKLHVGKRLNGTVNIEI